MDCKPKIGMIPVQGYPKDVGLAYAEKKLAPLRTILNVPNREHLIIPKLMKKTNEDKVSRIPHGDECLNISNFVVVSKGSAKKGFIDKPHHTSKFDLSLILSMNGIVNIPKAKMTDLKTKTPDVTILKVSLPVESHKVKDSSSVNSPESIPNIEIEAFVKRARKPRNDSGTSETKVNRSENHHEYLENVIQDGAILRIYMSKIKADPHQLVDKAKFMNFGSEMFITPNRNCSTTAKVFCTDFTKNGIRPPKIKFKYY